VATQDLLLYFLMYVVVPVWLTAGLADYFCHRASRIEVTSGVKESLLHALQFGEVGLPLLAVLFLQVNAAILLLAFGGLLLHQVTAIWDVRYANATRRVSPVEQHLHGVLEATPAIATVIIVILHWPAFRSLLGLESPSFALELKHVALPAWYLVAVLAGVVAAGVLPYGEELVRTARAAARISRRTPGGDAVRRG
jgi:hypothetical protein